MKRDEQIVAVFKATWAAQQFGRRAVFVLGGAAIAHHLAGRRWLLLLQR